MRVMQGTVNSTQGELHPKIARNAGSPSEKIYSVGRKKQSPHPDLGWVRLATDACGVRGTKERLSRELGVSNSTISRIVAGKLVSPELMIRMSRIIHIRAPKLVGGLEDVDRVAIEAFRDVLASGGPERVGELAELVRAVVRTIDALRAVLQITQATNSEAVRSILTPQVVADIERRMAYEWSRLSIHIAEEPPPLPPLPKISADDEAFVLDVVEKESARLSEIDTGPRSRKRTKSNSA